MPILTGGIINYGQRTANPTSPTPTEGSQYWHTTENQQYIYDGTNWNPLKIVLGWDQENTATHWWKSEGIASNSSWVAQAGGQNFGAGVTTQIVYNSSDSDFNNQKTLDFNLTSDSDSSRLETAEVDDGFWDIPEAFSVIMVLNKADHNSGTSLGDGLLVQVYNNGDTNSWSVDMGGDHGWGGAAGEHVGGISGYNTDSDYPKKGIFCFRCDYNGASSEYMFQPSGSSSFTTLATASSFPSGLPNSGYDRLAIGNFKTTSAPTNHEFSGTIAEIAYYKGSRVSDAELTRFSTYAKAKFSI